MKKLFLTTTFILLISAGAVARASSHSPLRHPFDDLTPTKPPQNSSTEQPPTTGQAPGEQDSVDSKENNSEQSSDVETPYTSPYPIMFEEATTPYSGRFKSNECKIQVTNTGGKIRGKLIFKEVEYNVYGIQSDDGVKGKLVLNGRGYPMTLLMNGSSLTLTVSENKNILKRVPPINYMGEWESENMSINITSKSDDVYGGTIAIEGTTSQLTATTLEEQKMFVVTERDNKSLSFTLAPGYDNNHANVTSSSLKTTLTRPAIEFDQPWSVPILNMQFAYVEPGSFTRGTDVGKAEEMPAHQVTLEEPFWIGQFEVTQEQWHRITNTHPSHFQGNTNPVEKISWEQVMKFCNQLTSSEREAERLPEDYAYTLPTEAQWEFAAKGGNLSQGYTFSGGNNLDEVAWFYDNSEDSTHPVGSKKSNELGLYDMTGNVWEWCYDRKSDYRPTPVTNPRGPSRGTSRINRGGCYFNFADKCLTINRHRSIFKRKYSYLGFRVCISTQKSGGGGVHSMAKSASGQPDDQTTEAQRITPQSPSNTASNPFAPISKSSISDRARENKLPRTKSKSK